MLNKKEHKRSTLMNAGMSASRKGLSQQDQQSERSGEPIRQPSTNRDGSPQKNLDHDGSSQLTYPNQHAQQFMPREQAQQLQQEMNAGFNQSHHPMSSYQVSNT